MLKKIKCIGVVEGDGEDVYDVKFYCQDVESEFNIPVDIKKANDFKIGAIYTIKFEEE